MFLPADKILKAKIYKEYLQIINKSQKVKKKIIMDKLYEEAVPRGNGRKEYSPTAKISHEIATIL